jgi:hypothetical protein
MDNHHEWEVKIGKGRGKGLYQCTFCNCGKFVYDEPPILYHPYLSDTLVTEEPPPCTPLRELAFKYSEGKHHGT